MSKVWFITGASRGIGLEIGKAALAAGEQVVATGRNPDAIAAAYAADDDRLLAVKLDVAEPEQSRAAVAAAQARFGRIDVLVNNAGYGQLGIFEDSSSEEAEQQFRINLFGTMAVTRAVLPGMRQRRSGHILNISSIGGLRGAAGASLYCSAKFALEGWGESLAQEIAPFGIHLTSVEPGFFRTDFLDSSSVRYAAHSLPDYAETAQELRSSYNARSYNQVGNPAKLAQAVLQLAGAANPPLHFLAGTDAIAVLEQRVTDDTEQLSAWRELSASTDHEA